MEPPQPWASPSSEALNSALAGLANVMSYKSCSILVTLFLYESVA